MFNLAAVLPGIIAPLDGMAQRKGVRIPIRAPFVRLMQG